MRRRLAAKCRRGGAARAHRPSAGRPLDNAISAPATAIKNILPIILTSRADSLLTRLASCAVAVLVAASRRQDISRVIS
jgi:hypothetical protein